MTIRSLIHEMRSRPHRVVHDSTESPPGSSADSEHLFQWSELPEELLRDILTRVEADDGGVWPSRRCVVACAGVCRGWRFLIKEIVTDPEISSKLTFPISLKQPGSRDSLIRCFIKRNRTSQTYHLYLGLTSSLTDSGKFLLAARKLKHAICTDYIISLHPNDISRKSNTFIGKLRSNFLGTKFTVFDGKPPNAEVKKKNRSSNVVKVSPITPLGSSPLAHISYELNVLGSRGPRRMCCTMDTIQAAAVEPGRVEPAPSRSEPTGSNNASYSDSGRPKGPALVLKNKAPRWHEHLRCWCLNFHGRVTVASVKNFQLVAVGEETMKIEEVVLQFGKVGKDMFTMDFGYPISVFQAFAICLSSFETRIACE